MGNSTKRYSFLNGGSIMVYIGRVPCNMKHHLYELCLDEKESVYGKYKEICIVIKKTIFDGKFLTVIPELSCNLMAFKISEKKINYVAKNTSH